MCCAKRAQNCEGVVMEPLVAVYLAVFGNSDNQLTGDEMTFLVLDLMLSVLDAMYLVLGVMSSVLGVMFLWPLTKEKVKGIC